MKQVNLTDFVKKVPQAEIGERLGVNQTSVSKMLRRGRTIILTVDKSGGIHDAIEIRKIGKFRTAA